MLRTTPAPGAPEGWALLTIRVSDHPAAPDRVEAALSIYPGADPAHCEAQLEAALETFRFRRRTVLTDARHSAR